MSAERDQGSLSEAPSANFSAGLLGIESLPGLGPRTRQGKVRDIWLVDHPSHGQLRIMLTTDRTSAYDRPICTIPGKGQVLTLLSEFWFKQTADIVPNHLLAVPHPNVMITRQAQEMLLVEVVMRQYLAKSSTSTSVHRNYFERGRREIYGIKFPEGLKANQEFPMGTIFTPTTKAKTGHDEELTDEEARAMVDSRLGEGTWERTKKAALAVFERAYGYHKERGLILVDTKYEFGVDNQGQLMLIDEIHTPDSSRFWLASSYEERMARGEDPESSDKEILRGWLAEQKFKGEEGEAVPEVTPAIIQRMAEAYRQQHRMITGTDLLSASTDPLEIAQRVLAALARL